jgi:hypothetical protein
MQRLYNAKILFIDKTFKVVPHVFCQLVTLKAYLLTKAYPISYILIIDKSEITYSRALGICNELCEFQIK